MHTRITFPLRKWTFAVALCLALLAAVAFSPSARAALQTLMREIGGVTFVGSDETPGRGEPETIVPEETVSLEEAQEKVPFAFNLPTWVPDGYEMSPSVRISYFPNTDENATTPFVYITWWKSQTTGGDTPIELTISPEVKWLVDLDHLEEVQINGEPAGLTGGGWDADTGQWVTTHPNLTLTWLHNDVMYQLRSPAATAEELIQMAESIQ